MIYTLFLVYFSGNIFLLVFDLIHQKQTLKTKSISLQKARDSDNVINCLDPLDNSGGIRRLEDLKGKYNFDGNRKFYWIKIVPQLLDFL